ncbi:hypothetical protein M4951_17000 [Blastopirellula sp. J2-11]|uniref:hypothetical protein n=1 Tax=Blastopirellula sp. J2-11 TaxID=2943192 RepID=UPI0021CABB10|nr:hypothetical protein [Blastopirellula sp. J2-11]UUO05076.1 hypothetical protein M4951_17000 [Blastopirellula sp. J2-11]
MYAAAILVATAAVGIDTGWRPAKDDPQGVEYIIQIEPELFKRLQDGKSSIEGVLPPDMPIENIRCFRVQIGDGELPREMPEQPASFEAPIEDNATLRKVEALELNPAPSSSSASTATPPLNALAADVPTPRYNNTLSSGVSNFPSGVTTGGTPLNPNTRTANAADTNPALRGSASNFSIPGSSTTTPVAPSSSSNRFSTTPLPSNSSTSTTYQGSSGYSSTPTTNQGSEYPAYTSPPLNNNSTSNNGQTSQPGGSTYQRFGDNYATPSTGQSGSGLNYNTGNGNSGSGYSSNLNNGSTNSGTNNNGSYNNGGLTPINSTPPSQNQNGQNQNSQNNNNNGNVVPPSNQQPNQNYQPQQPNYQQPYPQQPANPYGQPNYANPYLPGANPYYASAPGYPAQYNPYLAALPGYGTPPLAPPAQQPPTPTQTTPPAAAPSPSDRPARDLEVEKLKVAEPVERPYWMLVIVAFLSLGFNIYMGWMVVDFRTKYRDILAGFRELKAAN